MNALFDLAYDTQQSKLSLKIINDTGIVNANVTPRVDATNASPIKTPKAQHSQHSAHKPTKSIKSVSRTPQSNQNVKRNVSRKLVETVTTKTTSRSKIKVPSSPTNGVPDSLPVDTNDAPTSPTKLSKMKAIKTIEVETERQMKEWEDEMRTVLEKHKLQKAKTSQPSTILNTIRNHHFSRESIESSYQVSEAPIHHISPDHCQNPDRPWTDSDKLELVELTLSRIEGKRLGHKRFKKRAFHSAGDSTSEFHYLNVLECQSELQFEDYEYLSLTLDRSVPSLMKAINSLFTPLPFYSHITDSASLFDPLR